MITWDEYVDGAARTCAELPDEEKDIIHMLYGMMSELGELVDISKKELAYGKEPDEINLKEEIGDYSWYIGNYCRFRKIKIEDRCLEVKNLPNLSMLTMTEHLFILQGRITMLCSYFKDPSDTLGHEAKVIMDMIMHLNSMCHKREHQYREVLATNIAKLKERYPDSFNEEDALNRDVKSERKILE